METTNLTKLVIDALDILLKIVTIICAILSLVR